MRLSARNQFAGTITSLQHGSVNATIKVDIGGGNLVTPSITNEAVQDLGMAEGDRVMVVIKASDVLIGK